MRPTLLLIALGLTLAACGSSGPKRPTPQGVIYDCDDYPDLDVQFAADKSEARVVLENGDTITLVRQPVANGFAYSDGAYAMRGVGDKLEWMIGRRAPIKCEVD